MKVALPERRKGRIEMIPLIDIVFLLLVVFIYAMLSMAVHRGLPVALPASAAAEVEKNLVLAVTVEREGTIYLDKVPVPLEELTQALTLKAEGETDPDRAKEILQKTGCADIRPVLDDEEETP